MTHPRLQRQMERASGTIISCITYCIHTFGQTGISPSLSNGLKTHPPISYHTLEFSRSPLGTASYLGMAVYPWQDPCNGKTPARGAQRTNSFPLGRRPWNGEPKGASERHGEGPTLWNPGIRGGPEDTDPGLRAPRKAWGGAGQDAHQVSPSPPSPGLSPPGIDSVSSTRVM